MEGHQNGSCSKTGLFFSPHGGQEEEGSEELWFCSVKDLAAVRTASAGQTWTSLQKDQILIYHVASWDTQCIYFINLFILKVYFSRYEMNKNVSKSINVFIVFLDFQWVFMDYMFTKKTFK